MSRALPISHEFRITDADQSKLYLVPEFESDVDDPVRLRLIQEFSILENDQPKLYFNSEYGPTYIHRIRIREVTNLGVSDLKIEDINLYHPDEDSSLSGFAYDEAEDSFIVEREFGFDPSLLRVSYSLYGQIEGVGYRYWSYKDQIPEVVWS